jgi:putative hydrolase of HD superfamily
MINEIIRLKRINDLKKVYRLNSVELRQESSAEHSWSCLILADYFLEKENMNRDKKIDKLEVYDLLIYHDLVEVETGDIALNPNIKKPISKDQKKKNEFIAADKLKNELPEKIGTKFSKIFLKYESQNSVESKFAKAIDAFDAILQSVGDEHRHDWKGWTREFLYENKYKYFNEFECIKKTFEELLDYLDKNGYFKI